MAPTSDRSLNLESQTERAPRVIVPAAPPELTHDAARVLLRILLRARETLKADDTAA